MLSEKWKQLSHNQIRNGYYLSSYGRIRYEDNDPYEPTYHSSNGYDYSLFVLKNNEGDPSRHQRLFPIDDLIGITFIPISEELENKPIRINHIDNDLRNNHINNLEWVEDVEEWRLVTYPGVTPDMYEVSSLGRVRDIDHNIKNIGFNYYGYNRVVLKSYACYKEYMIHRLVAWEFCSYDNNFNTNHINHIDGIKNHNYPKNLESISNQENTKHAKLVGLIQIGEDKNNSTLTNNDVTMICKLIVKHKGNIEAVLYDLQIMNIHITSKHLNCIKNKNSWKFISDKYFVKDEFRSYETHLKESDVIKICELLVKYNKNCKTVVEIAKQNGIVVSLSAVKHISSKNSWRKVSDKYF